MNPLSSATASPALEDYKSFLTPQAKSQQPPERFYIDRSSPSGLSTKSPITPSTKKSGTLWSNIVGVFWTDPEELAQNKELRESLLQAIQDKYPKATNLMEQELTSLPDLKGPEALQIIHQAGGIHTAMTSITASLASIKKMTEKNSSFPTVQKVADGIEEEAALLVVPPETNKNPAATLDKKLQSLQKLQMKAHFLLELREELANDLKNKINLASSPTITTEHPAD